MATFVKGERANFFTITEEVKTTVERRCPVFTGQVMQLCCLPSRETDTGYVSNKDYQQAIGRAIAEILVYEFLSPVLEATIQELRALKLL